MPELPLARYSVMKSEPPPTARLRAPNTPLDPAVLPADVDSSIGPFIQESSPDSATTLSPESSFISRTGMTVPIT
jgi:hypothetical protein